MRTAHLLPLVALLLFGHSPLSISANAPVALSNDNRSGAGVLRDGILTIALEAKLARWYPNGETMRGREIAAFAVEGAEPSVPGPLIRVTRGTEIHATILNSLADTLFFRMPSMIRGVDDGIAMDTILVAPGQRRELRMLASRPGNFIYRAAHDDTVSRGLRMSGQLAGAIVVDSSVRQPVDRVMVISMSADSVSASGVPLGNIVFAINGKSWPQTERLVATVGDTTRWRVLNASQDPHPMHLHGFYFRVDEFRVSGPARDPGVDGRLAVTHSMPPFSTLSMSWVPERAGNWLFHCHFQLHLNKPKPLELPPLVTPPANRDDGHENHATSGMSGLVMAIAVAPRPGVAEATDAGGRLRKLRLIAIQDREFPDTAPSMRFVIEENGKRIEAGPGFSPALNLVKGQPVSIMVVNHLPTATAVHWHGMELDSYFDGVAGLSGIGAKLAPMIAPRDSFDARFNPPRSGTFIYHSHSDEPRTHRAGLLGAMIVRDDSSVPSANEAIFFLKAARAGRGGAPIDMNGQADPDTIVLRAGTTSRLRFLALTVFHPGASVVVTSNPDSIGILRVDSMTVPMRIVAKDGAELPRAEQRMIASRQAISMGETYDFELGPQLPRNLRVEVRAGNGVMLARVPLVVR